jgi:soluble P-type ATPase
VIKIEISGWGNMAVEQIVLDMNGTLASDGKISTEVKKRINSLSEKARIYVLTADTQGTANEEVRDMKVELIKVPEEDSANGKLKFFNTLTPETTVVIGNGSNDQLVLKGAGLAIAVLGDEGVSVSAMKHADVLVKSISDALDLFLKPKRLIATLKE